MTRQQARASALGVAATRRELAVARVLDPARARAETRVQRFLDAALELMNSGSGTDFTVQEVVERSGQSLRSFYQYFDGKHELLLAVFEECARAAAEQLSEQVAGEENALERLHRFALEFYQLCRPPARTRVGKKMVGPALVDFAQQLLAGHPEEASRAFVPLIELCERLLEDAAAAGAVRAELRHRRIAGFMLQAIMFNAYIAAMNASSASADADEAAADMWDLLFHGLQSAEPR